MLCPPRIATAEFIPRQLPHEKSGNTEAGDNPFPKEVQTCPYAEPCGLDKDRKGWQLPGGGVTIWQKGSCNPHEISWNDSLGLFVFVSNEEAWLLFFFSKLFAYGSHANTAPPPRNCRRGPPNPVLALHHSLVASRCSAKCPLYSFCPAPQAARQMRKQSIANISSIFI